MLTDNVPKKKVKARRVKPKPTPVKAPAGDVASSGGDYGMPEAKQGARTQKVRRDTAAVYADQPAARKQQILQNATSETGATVRKVHARRIKRNQELKESAAQKDTKGDADRQRTAAFLEAHSEILHPKPKGRGSLLATITAGTDLARKVAPIAAVAPFGAAKGVDKVTGSRIADFMADTVKNAPKDAAELVTTTPTSLVKLGDTAIHDPEKVPGILAQPYKDLIKDPLGTVRTHPVSTVLMLDPAVKVPGKIAGKGLRLAGQQTLERTPKTLPGTALKEKVPASRDAAVNVMQKRKDAKNPAPQMSVERPAKLKVSDVQRRVDEFYDYDRHKSAQQAAAVARKAKDQAKTQGAKRKERNRAAGEAAAQMQGSAPAKAASQVRFAREFGATHEVHRHSPAATPQIVKPKDAEHGSIYKTREDASLVAASIDADPKITWKPRVISVGSKFAVVPDTAAKRLQVHRTVGTSKAPTAILLRRGRANLTQAALPTSPKWLGGQVAEAGYRSVVQGAGPADWLRMRKVVKKMNAEKKGSGDELLMRVEGGHFGLTGPARDYASGTRTLADDLAHTDMARGAQRLTNAAAKPGVRHVRAGWRAYSRAVLGSINGVIERNTRIAMSGHIVQQGLLDNRVLSLSDKAIADAAQGLKATDAQVQLARELDRAYGKYSKFSPDRRQQLMHTTPFLPWYLNTVQFLTKVIPGDHPIHAALLASADQAEMEWRKGHGLSLYSDDRKPDWMLGGYPTKAGIIPVQKFLPFGIGTDLPGALAGLVVPQFATPILNAIGVDYKGDQLTHPGFKGQPFSPSEKGIRAILSAIEGQVPVARQAAVLSGLEDWVNKKDPTKAKSIRARLNSLVNPVAAIPNTDRGSGSPGGGTGGPLPPGVSQRELDALISEAQEAATAQPVISQREIDALIREQLGG